MKISEGKTVELQSGCCSIFVTVNRDENNHPFEVFCSPNGNGGCTALLTCLCRVISIALQNGTPIEEIKKTLAKPMCPSCARNTSSEGKSCGDVIARLL